MYNLIQWPRHSCMWHSTLYKKKDIRCLYSFVNSIYMYLSCGVLFSWYSIGQIIELAFFTDSFYRFWLFRTMRTNEGEALISFSDSNLWISMATIMFNPLFWNVVRTSKFVFTTMSWGVLLFHSALLDCGEGGPIRGLYGVRNTFSFAP